MSQQRCQDDGEEKLLHRLLIVFPTFFLARSADPPASISLPLFPASLGQGARGPSFRSASRETIERVQRGTAF